MSDILTALEKRRLSSINRSIQYSEQCEQSVRQQAAEVKSLLSGKKQVIDGLSAEAQNLRLLYYSMLRDYRGDIYKSKPLTKRGRALWLRVEKAWRRAGCDPKKYMHAQFKWFHKAFGKAPEVQQLATDGAVDRAREYTGTTEFRVMGVKKANIGLADLFRESEALLREVMRAQKCKSREEFYKDFVLTGMLCFPKQFLKADPAYERAMNGQ